MEGTYHPAVSMYSSHAQKEGPQLSANFGAACLFRYHIIEAGSRREVDLILTRQRAVLSLECLPICAMNQEKSAPIRTTM